MRHPIRNADETVIGGGGLVRLGISLTRTVRPLIRSCHLFGLLGRLACGVEGAAGVSVFVFAVSLAVSLAVFSLVDELVSTRQLLVTSVVQSL